MKLGLHTLRNSAPCHDVVLTAVVELMFMPLAPKAFACMFEAQFVTICFVLRGSCGFLRHFVPRGCLLALCSVVYFSNWDITLGLVIAILIVLVAL